jgi:hypothetical protein
VRRQRGVLGGHFGQFVGRYAIVLREAKKLQQHLRHGRQVNGFDRVDYRIRNLLQVSTGDQRQANETGRIYPNGIPAIPAKGPLIRPNPGLSGQATNCPKSDSGGRRNNRSTAVDGKPEDLRGAILVGN